MMIEVSAPPKDLVLDPFAYVPDMGSRVAGLGGHGRPAEGDYVFHTHYVPVAEGMAHFTIRFTGLEATQGAINLRVHMLTDASPHAKLAAAERVAFNRMVMVGGTYTLRFEAFGNAIYAFYGGLVGSTDARAVAADVVLDRPLDPNARRDYAAEARNTDYGDNALPMAHIISMRSASLQAPTTQLATARQLREPETKRLPVSACGDPVAQWRAAFVVQALRCYGMAVPGARGVGLGWEALSMATLVAGEGPTVDIIRPPDERGMAAEDAIQAAPNVDLKEIDLTTIGPEIVNYDFLWTNGIVGRRGTLADGVRWIESAMVCVRPGGFAVHVVDFDPLGTGLGFDRNHIEQIMLQLISRGHEVAEFRIDADRLLVDHGLSACGIIARKAPLATDV